MDVKLAAILLVALLQLVTSLPLDLQDPVSPEKNAVDGEYPLDRTVRSRIQDDNQDWRSDTANRANSLLRIKNNPGEWWRSRSERSPNGSKDRVHYQHPFSRIKRAFSIGIGANAGLGAHMTIGKNEEKEKSGPGNDQGGNIGRAVNSSLFDLYGKSGMPNPGATYPGLPYPGTHLPRVPYPGSPYPGASYPGSTYPGSTYPGSTYPGSTYPGSTYPGSTYPGSPYPGSPYPGVPYPGAPYPGDHDIRRHYSGRHNSREDAWREMYGRPRQPEGNGPSGETLRRRYNLTNTMYPEMLYPRNGHNGTNNPGSYNLGAMYPEMIYPRNRHFEVNRVDAQNPTNTGSPFTGISESGY